MDRIPLADSPAAVGAGSAGRAPQRRAETDGSSQDGRPNGGRAGERTKCGCSTLWWTCGGGQHLTGLRGTWRTRCSGCSRSSRWRLGGRKWVQGESLRVWTALVLLPSRLPEASIPEARTLGQLGAVLDANRPWRTSAAVTSRRRRIRRRMHLDGGS